MLAAMNCLNYTVMGEVRHAPFGVIRGARSVTNLVKDARREAWNDPEEHAKWRIYTTSQWTYYYSIVLAIKTVGDAIGC